MSLADYQKKVDDALTDRKLPYWQPLSQMAFLTEEIGELARLLNHIYGDKPKKPTEAYQELGGELGDIIYGVICIANREKIDLDEAIEKTINKAITRDKDRFEKKI